MFVISDTANTKTSDVLSMAKDFYSNTKTPDEQLSNLVGNVVGGAVVGKVVNSINSKNNDQTIKSEILKEVNPSNTEKLYNGTRNPNLDFLNTKGESTLATHATKHGYASPEKYLEDARKFLEQETTLTTQSFMSSEGTYFRYDTATNEFGIVNKYGGISTYYKPENGKLYWLEQIKKYAPK